MFTAFLEDVRLIPAHQGLEPETIPENESPQGPSPFRRRVCTFEAAASCLQSSNTLKALKVSPREHSCCEDLHSITSAIRPLTR